MIFVFKRWNDFCKGLKEKGMISIPAYDIHPGMTDFLVLKHDIENTVAKAFELAEIEHQYGHRGTYYLHAYLLDDPRNVEILKKMQNMGHEISYHYDVMDSNNGNIEKAMFEFETNRKRFESLGFHIKTVCQHGNPVVERIGYNSNRDFFRDVEVQRQYPQIADIMVDFKQKYRVEYTYYSDVGRKFKMIYDPINNDIVNSDNKNVPYDELEELLQELDKSSIVSTHPHRWTTSAIAYILKEKSFKVIKAAGNTAMKVPALKKIMSHYYYFAKRI